MGAVLAFAIAVGSRALATHHAFPGDMSRHDWLTPAFDIDGIAGGLADAFNFEQTMAQQL
ncbi:MAG: hypothetical protein GZ093_19275 [Rhodoferax sp.]|uniref:hypothetical protein n=1 Tax=Rhodoferax sp. TaxID=50421 RepID=UPI0013FFDA91|nr:hypothetical protein [Rhodoferax sp.]NDP40837.1 hypothetical protein [Rhodoferax sp.]